MRGTFVLTAALIVGSIPAGAAQIVQTAAIDARAAGWSDALGFAQADPALGTLTGVTLDLTGTVGGRLHIENRDLLPVDTRTTLAGGVTAFLPGGGAFATAVPWSSTRAALAEFDNVLDFAGPSGRSFALNSGAHSATGTINVGRSGGSVDVSDFVGTGRVSLPVTTSVRSTITAGGNVTGAVLPTAGASGTLTYTQEPPGAPGSRNSSSGVFTMVNLPPLRFTPFGLIATAPQVRTVAPQPAGWRQLLDFAPFDPTLGTLWSASLEMRLPAHFTQGFENLGTADSAISASQYVRLTLERGEGIELAVADAEVTGDYALVGFDGLQDGLGVSGGSSGFDEESETSAELFGDEDGNAAFFAGASPVWLQLSVFGTSSIAGDNAFSFDLGARAGAEVTLWYNYLVEPEFASFAIGGMSDRFVFAGQRSSLAGPVPNQIAAPPSLAALAASLMLLGLSRTRKR